MITLWLLLAEVKSVSVSRHSVHLHESTAVLTYMQKRKHATLTMSQQEMYSEATIGKVCSGEHCNNSTLNKLKIQLNGKLAKLKKNIYYIYKCYN